MNVTQWSALLTLALFSQAHAQNSQTPPANPPTLVLDNGGFEGPYQAATGTGEAVKQKGHITGQIANGWSDNSGWADVTADYEPDTNGAHGGTTAQRVDVKEIRSGAVQFVQTKSLLKSHVYRAQAWLRTTTSQNIEVTLREAGAPYKTLGSRLVAVGDTWKKVTFSTTAPEDAQTFFMLRPAGIGTFWVDDASLEDLTNASSEAPPRTGNLVADGSFEAGFGAGWAFRTRTGPTLADSARYEFADTRPSIDGTNASLGKSSLKAVIPAGLGFYIWSPPTEFNFGRVHTGSVDLKADRDNVSVDLAFDGSPLTKTVTVGTKWQRYSLSGVLPYAPQTFLKITCFSGSTPATLWIDGAQIQEGAADAPTYQAANPVELALSVPRPGAVFFDGETATIQANNAGAPAGSRLRCTVTDLYGATRSLPEIPLPATSITVPATTDHPRGMFKLAAQVVGKDGAPLSPQVFQVFARLPKPRELAPENSFFGAHIPLTPGYFAICRAVGSRWARLHDASILTKWPAIQPKPDTWQFVDDGAKGARAAGIQVLGMFDGAPLWATLHPSTTAGYWSNYNVPDAPGAKDQWAEYVRRTAEHYKGTIDYWEIWNEPWGQGNFAGTPQQFGELLKMAYPAAKAGNPGSTVVGVDAAVFKPDFTTGVLGVASTASFDAFSYHDYNSSLYGGATAPAIRYATDFRATQNKYGEAKPIWLSEGGADKLASWYGDESDGISPRTQLAYIVRFDVTNIGAGVKRFFYYTLAGDTQYGSSGYTALEHDRTIRPLLAGQAVLASLIDGVPCQGRTEPVPGVDAYTFGPDNGKTVTVLWSYAGASHTVPVPAGTRVLDVQGNPVATGASVEVGNEPIYFLK